MVRLDKIDIGLLRLAQGDLEVAEMPFDGWAQTLGLPVAELLERLARLKRQGVIRDFKAILRHRRSGISANAMVTWVVPPEDCDAVGATLAGFDCVTHCYERSGFEPYTIFSMVHAASDAELEDLVAEMALEAGITGYKIFWSERELKKTSMQYF